MAPFCFEHLNLAARHYVAFVEAHQVELEQQQLVPRSVLQSRVNLVPLSDWTSGFPAGCLWLLFEHTRSDYYRQRARRWTQALFEQRLNTSTHDVGFTINNSYGVGLRYGGEAGYATVVVDAAHSLCTRYDARVGALRNRSQCTAGTQRVQRTPRGFEVSGVCLADFEITGFEVVPQRSRAQRSLLVEAFCRAYGAGFDSGWAALMSGIASDSSE
jgi:hypothetical protein